MGEAERASEDSSASSDSRPKLAEKAHDLEALKKTVEDAAAVSGGLWLSYLFVLFYLAIAASTVTHVELLLESPIKLPFLGIELPLKAFFFLAPILFLISHAYTLAHFRLLADKAKRFHDQLSLQLPNEEDAITREGLRAQLPSNIFVQFLAGPKDLREGWFGVLLRVIAWATLVVAPVLLLLLLQIQFLAYHGAFITWTHRVALLVDLLLVWWLWRSILSGRSDFRHWRAWTARAAQLLALVFSCAAVIFSVGIATFPGEWQEDLPSIAVIPTRHVWLLGPGPITFPNKRLSLHEALFGGEVDYTTRSRKSAFSNTLVLPGFNLYEALKIDSAKKPEQNQYLLYLRYRDLTGAIMNGARLPWVDFTGARLQGGNLEFTQLQHSLFRFAQLQGTPLRGAHLEEASLELAQLQDVGLDGAHLQGAWLWGAQLQGASLIEARMQGAVLNAAQLQGAQLARAYLHGASLVQTRLEGAGLYEARLSGAILIWAELEGAFLIAAQLNGASLYSARLHGAELDRANLEGASLKNAQLQGASLAGANLASVDISETFLWRAILPENLPRNMSARKEPRWGAESEDPPSVSNWGKDSYAALLQKMEYVIPKDNGFREAALERIKILDCENANASLAPCDGKAQAPARFGDWLRGLSKVEEGSYQDSLASTLGALVCSGDGDAAYVAAGLWKNGRIKDTGVKASTLVERILSKDCPVSAVLNDSVKAGLRAVAREAPKAEKK